MCIENNIFGWKTQICFTFITDIKNIANVANDIFVKLQGLGNFFALEPESMLV